jgi:hypothetical protein
MVFKAGFGSLGYNLGENEIRYAMENTKSLKAASRFLNISLKTLRKYATQYIDAPTGKNLYELHKNEAGKGIHKQTSPKMTGKWGLHDILEGKFPDYPARNLKFRLIRAGLMEEKCHHCGYEERRITDYSVPLLLDWVDGDKTNHHRDNLQMLCYNCYFCMVGNPFNAKQKNTSK